MANVLNSLGPFASPPCAAVYEVTERAWAQYRAMLPVQNEEDPPAHFMSRRMMHISEVTSLAVRLNASWGLIHAAMSLLRDRYEQAIRFSWLARQPDGTEAQKYRLYFYSKTRSLLRNMPEQTRKRMEAQFGPTPKWVTRVISKEEKARLKEWENNQYASGFSSCHDEFSEDETYRTYQIGALTGFGSHYKNRTWLRKMK